MLLSDKAIDAASMTWDEFNMAFLERFLPNSMREAKAHEFETLVQTLGMLMVEYSVKFTELAKYAPYLIIKEKMWT